MGDGGQQVGGCEKGSEIDQCRDTPYCTAPGHSLIDLVVNVNLFIAFASRYSISIFGKTDSDLTVLLYTRILGE